MPVTDRAAKIVPFTCEQCGRRFTAFDGGICSRCGRTLCFWHLHGVHGLLRIFSKAHLAHVPVCLRCVRKPSAATND